jgi:hypothetical protein
LKITKPQPAAVGDKLIKALTKDQVAQLLSAIFNMLDEQKLNEISSAVDQDISTTLSRLLAAKKREAKPHSPKRIVSDQKLIAEWEKLWSEWDEIAEEAGNEEGKYIYQEHHWEHPYFTGDDLSEDLEQIAEKMQGEKFIPLLMKCWQQNIAMLVPDPARSSKSSYEYHAAWLAVVNELNPAACRAIIGHWKVDHKKRRNLWLAIKAKKLPVEGSKPEKLFV